MADQDQHDFDDFDNLTDEAPAVELDEDDDVSFGRPDEGRQKRQMIFYLALAGVLIVAIGSAWFLFIRTPDNATTVTAQEPVPVVAENASAPQQNNGGLPPGVTSSQGTNGAPAPAANGSIVPVDPNSVNPEVATPQVASPEVAAVENTAPAAATVSSTGTTAEALPPPIPPAGQNAAPIAPATADTATSVTPVAPATPDMATPANAPAMAANQASAMPLPTPTNAPASTPTDVTPLPAPTAEPETMPPANKAAAPETAPPVASGTAVTPVTSAAPAPAVDNTAQAAETAALKDQIKELNDKLDQANQQVTTLEQQNNALSSEKSSAKENKLQAIEPVTPSEPKPAKKKAAAHKAKAVKSSASSPSASSNWELRSAQPGAAWLGKPGKDELVRYGIGQNVPGLGTIQDVTQEGGRWIVKTTGGTLRE